MSKSSKGMKVGVRGRQVGPVCVAALAVLTAAGEARADTNVTVPSTGWSRAYANSSWASAGSDLGTFGAGLSYSTALSTDGQGAVRSTDNKVDLDIELFGQSFTFAGVEGKLATSSATDTSPQEYFGVNVGGFTLLSQTLLNTQTDSIGASVTLGEYNGGGFKFDLNVTGSYSFTGFSVCLEASATKDFNLGPIPVTVTGALDGCPYVSVQTATSGTSSDGKPKLDYDFKPGIDTSFTLSAGLGSSDYGSFGMWGSADIINYGTDLTSSMTFDPSSKNLGYRIMGVESLSSLSGSAGAYVSVGYKALSVTYQKTFWSWDGITWQSQVVLCDSKPAASEVEVVMGPTQATGSYQYADSESVQESGSTFQWYRANDSSGTGAQQVTGSAGTGTAYTYGWAGYTEDNMYLQFCVTPKNSGGNRGDQSCSAWTPIGATLKLYKDAGYQNTAKTFAYEKGGSTSQCINVGSDFHDLTSSFMFQSPVSASTTVWFFKNEDCTGDRLPQNVPRNGGYSQNMSYYGSSWNDAVDSFLVVWGEAATVSNLSVDIDSTTATAQYAFSDSAGLPESGSQYQWYRANDKNGSGGAAILGAMGRSYTLTGGDAGKFLRVCMSPSTGFLTTSQVCSDWSAGVGDLLKLYQDANLSGNTVLIAYEHSSSGTCFNLPDYGFNDKLTSWDIADDWTGKEGETIVFYKDANCSGSTLTYGVPAGYDGYNQNGMPSGWNDAVSSVAVTWTPTVSISTPTVTVSGNRATSSHTYTDTTGHLEQSTYQWYVANDASGSGGAPIANVYGPTYALTGVENNKYLQVCINPTNGVTIGNRRCSAFVPVGYEVQFFSEPSLSSSTATSVAFAYQQTPTSTCFNMSDYGFDDVARAFQGFGSSSSSIKVFVYQAPDCTTPTGDFHAAYQTNQGGYYTPPGGIVHSASGKVYSTQLGSRYDSTISSFKVEY